MRRKILSAILLVLLVTSFTAGHDTNVIKPIPQEAFVPFAIPSATTGPKVIVEPFDTHVVHVKPSLPPVIAVPKIEPKKTSKPATVKTRSVSGVNGVASWYCKTGVSRCTRGHPGGLYAAIRRDLLHLRGKTVTVTHNGKSISVKIIDCNCGPHANLIDLYSDAFRRLAPLSRGAIKVRVEW